MNPAHLDRILAFVCDTIDRTGGDWDATEAAIRREYDTDEELEMALDCYAVGMLIVYAEPGGPAMVRGIRDRLRRIIPTQPPGGRWFGRGR